MYALMAVRVRVSGCEISLKLRSRRQRSRAAQRVLMLEASPIAYRRAKLAMPRRFSGKYPVIHGFLVPLVHRLKGQTTEHYRITARREA